MLTWRIWKEMAITIVTVMASTAQGQQPASPVKESGAACYRHRAISNKPADTWEKAMVTGNGIQGAMVMGRPDDETIVLNHAGMFLPLYPPFPTVSQAKILPELRKLIDAGKFQEAADRVVSYGKSEGKNNEAWTDPFVPVCSLKLIKRRTQPGGKHLPGLDYRRETDFMTGQASVAWKDGAVAYLRSVFVSRPNNVVVVMQSPADDCDLEFVLHDPNIGAKGPRKGAIKESIAKAELTPEGGILTCRTVFAHRWPGSLQGCEVAARVIVTGGKTTVAGDRLQVRNGGRVLILIRSILSRDIDQSKMAELVAELQKFTADYHALLARHEAVHQAIMERCQIELGSKQDDRRTSPELFAQSKVGALDPRLLENEFDACRYLVLSSSGPEYPPNLQGIWGATWSPAWSGDYTQNGNLQTVVAGSLAANMPETLDGFFRYLERQLPEYRDNARRLFGTRGIHIPHRTSTHGQNNRWTNAFPMTFWTAGAAWNAQFFYDYYQVTGDKKFLLTRALPWMKEAAAFYEDFMDTGVDGKWVFNPSYSPENDAGNTQSQAAVNATMDIAAAKELFRNLVTICGKLDIEAENVAKWKAILAKIPDYPVNADGAVAEWRSPLLADNYEHRHASHLYALYAGLPPDVAADPRLQTAFKVAIEKRMEWRRTNHGAEMAFGLCQLGWSASSLRDATTAYETVDWLANQFWFPESMVTSHNCRSIFNIDLAGGLPQLVLSMLVQSEPSRIDLLPALPKEWPAGSVTGVLCRGQIEICRLTWAPDRVAVTLRSAIDQKVSVHVDGLIEMCVTAGRAKIEGEVSGNSRSVALAAGDEATLEMRRTGGK